MSTAARYLYRFAAFLAGFLYRVLFGLRVEGREHVPGEGPAILFANHLSWHDIPLLAIAAPRPIRFMAKAELFRPPLVGAVLRFFGAFPVRRGAADRQAIREALAALAAGELLGIFPEGTRVRPGQTGRAEPGVAYLAWKSGAPVVPAAISGTPRLFGRVTVRIGPPIRLEGFSPKPDSEEWAAASARLMAAVAGLQAGDSRRRGAS
ncbi:MAG: lysophospholipid acyltransferase family protein [Bacillota bacterium]